MKGKEESIEELIPIKIKAGLGYDIIIGRELDTLICDEFEGDVFAVIDENVYSIYNDNFHFDRLGNRLFILKSGEKSKQWKYLQLITEKMLASGCNRYTKVLSIGGGVTGDLTGFAAAIFMRGIKIIHIPTTLLSSVDSSIGGKTGINIGRFKNIVGAFYQPSKIIINIKFLSTLSIKEIKCGIGEIIKTALLSKEIFDYVNGNIAKIMVLDEKVILEIITKCIKFKDCITSSDERETSLRKILNVGHTIGHGLENIDKFRLSHGEYVLNGIEVETKLARQLSLIGEDYYKDIMKLLNADSYSRVKIKNTDKLIKVMKSDKKNAEGKIDFIFAKDYGETQEYLIDTDNLKIMLEALL